MIGLSHPQFFKNPDYELLKDAVFIANSVNLIIIWYKKKKASKETSFLDNSGAKECSRHILFTFIVFQTATIIQIVVVYKTIGYLLK